MDRPATEANRRAAPRGSLRTRLLLAFSLALATFVATQVWQITRLRRTGTALEMVSHVYLPLTRLTARMDALAESRHPERIRPLVADARALVAGAEPTDAEETTAIEALSRQIDRLDETLDRAADDPDALNSSVTRLSTLVDGRVAVISARTARQHDRTVRSALALTLVSLGVAGGVLLLSTRALRPIQALTLRAQALGAGRDPGALEVTGDDEIAALAHSFGEMAEAVAQRDRDLVALSNYLRRVLDQIASAVVVQEAGVLRVTNPAAQSLWQVQPGPYEGLPAPLRALDPGRHELRWDDGRVHDVTVVPFGEDGRLFVGEDVTERNSDRERLQRSERLALIGQMLAQVTHEVRNPLNAISLNAELLRDELRTAEALSLLDGLMAEIRRLEGVTERYLDLARRRPPTLGPEDPARLTRAVVELEEERLRRAGVQVQVRASSGSTVETDGNALRHVLLNLLRNTAEAGATTVTVTVEVGPDQLEIQVADDGHGVDSALAPSLFTPFATTRARGTGLGLAVSRQLVEDLGGTLRHHETNPDAPPGARGATFVVTVPLGARLRTVDDPATTDLVM